MDSTIPPPPAPMPAKNDEKEKINEDNLLNAIVNQFSYFFLVTN
jgi:hypothetical protein